MLLLTLTTLAIISTTIQQTSSSMEALRGRMELWETWSLGRKNLTRMSWMLKVTTFRCFSYKGINLITFLDQGSMKHTQKSKYILNHFESF